jgi:hypothetical protein
VRRLVIIDRSRLRLSCRGKSLVSGVTTARVAPTLELILRGLEVAQLSGAERTPAASDETQDDGSVAAQLLGGVETAVGVWQEEIWRGVSDLQRARDGTSL